MGLSIKIKGKIAQLQHNPLEVDLEIELPEKGFALLISAITCAGTGPFVALSRHNSVKEVLKELDDG